MQFKRDKSNPAENQVYYGNAQFKNRHIRDCCVRSGVDLEGYDYEEAPVVSPLPPTNSNTTATAQLRPAHVRNENVHPNAASARGSVSDDLSDEESTDPSLEHVNSGLNDARDSRPANVKAEMEMVADEFVTENLAMSPNNIYLEISRKMTRKYGKLYHGHNREYIPARVHRVRAKLNFGDTFRAAEGKYSRMANGEDFFLHSHYVFPEPKYGVFQRIMIFANPALVCLLSALAVDIFIDATFGCTPMPFYQILIIMIHDPITNMYAPVIYALMTHKTQASYW